MPEAVAGVTVRDAVAHGTARLDAAGCDSPRLDAELLLCCALGGVPRSRLVLDALAPLDPEALGSYEALLARRAPASARPQPATRSPAGG